MTALMKNYLLRNGVAGAFCLFCAWNTAIAESTRYISDELEVTLRSGESTRHQVLRMLTSGTPVEVLGTNPETGYSRVRDPKGTEGYILTRYLSAVPVARDQLEQSQKKLANAEAEIRRLRDELKQRTDQNKTLAAEQQKETEEARRLDEELDTIRKTAASALAIDQENRTNKARLLTLEQEMQVLRQENAALKDRTARDWFLVGTGVVLLGMVIGLIIPKIRWQKKSSWDSL